MISRKALGGAAFVERGVVVVVVVVVDGEVWRGEGGRRRS